MDDHGRQRPDPSRADLSCVPLATDEAGNATAPPRSSPLIGIALKVASALAFTLMSAGIKWVGPDYPTGQIVFFRSAFALAPLLLWLSWQGDLVASVRTRDLKGHILRGLISSCGMFSGFVALSYLPLADSVAIGYASPLITVVLAVVLLGERVRIYRWSAVAAGFVGVMIMLAPHLQLGSASTGLPSSSIGAAFGILAACCSAGATIQVRRLTATETTGAIVLYFTLLTTTLGAATAPLGWTMPSLADFVSLILIGVLGGIGQILLTISYRHADASLVAPFDYTTMIWAFLLSWLAFGQFPDTSILIGGTVVTLAGLFVIWRERRLGLLHAKPRAAGAQRSL